MLIDYQNSGWPHILSRNRATSSVFIIPDFSYNARRILRKGWKSLKYYKATIENLFKKIEKSIKHITTNDLREYLDNYQKEGNASKITIDNIRRIFSSFFAWLEEEDYILKSPVRRIHKVKTGMCCIW